MRGGNVIDDIDITQYAFEMEPQFTQARDGTWTATYPGADWSVSAPSEADARDKLGEEFIRRQNSGNNPLTYAEQVYRRHLSEPVPGVYAIDNELYRELVHASQAERERVVREAERRRVAGLSYTRADYEAEKASAQAE